MIDERTQQLTKLLHATLELAQQPDAPLADISPVNLIIHSLGIVVDEGPDEVVGALIGALAWIAHHHWDSVGSALREANEPEFLH